MDEETAEQPYRDPLNREKVLRDLRAENVTLRENHDKAQREINTYVQRCAQLEAENIALRDNREALLRELQIYRNEEEARQTHRAEHASGDAVAVQAELDRAYERIGLLSDEVEHYRTRCHELTVQLDAQAHQLQAAYIIIGERAVNDARRAGE